MIEQLKKQDNSEFPYIDKDGVSHPSKKAFLQQEVFGFCGCGNPDEAMIFIHNVLQLINQEKGWGNEMQCLIPSEGVYYFVLYTLDDKKLTEHGTSIGGSWLTPKGKEVLADIEWCLQNETKEI